MPDEHWQDTLSEETRQMIHDSTQRAWGRFIDEIVTPPTRTSKEQQRRQQLARRIKNIAGDLSLEGRDDDANVLYEVVEALGGCE